MKQYHELLQAILDRGEIKGNRTGVETKGLFGCQMRFPLGDGFPAMTTKRLAWKSVVSELLWFLEGSTDERRLAEIHHGLRDESKSTIWTANADKQGKDLGYQNDDKVKELGPVYGYQWRNFGGTTWDRTASHKRYGTDQIKRLLHDLRHNPLSRRHILSAWDATQVEKMALPPCHLLAQFHVGDDNKLSCQMYQRSCDMFLGVPFNIASYSLLTHMMAQISGLGVGEFIWVGGDSHIYLNHLDQVKEQLSRTPRNLPTLDMPAFKNLDELLSSKVDDYRLIGYDPHPPIKAPMAV